METKNPAFRELVEDVFARAGFVRELGIELVDVGVGWCETRLEVGPRHLQQNGVVHAGVHSTLADHTAGAAAASLVGPDEYVLTVEFQVHLLRAAPPAPLHCRADVLKPGARFSVVEASVYSDRGDRRELVSKLTATVAVLGQGAGQRS
ncbi:MAG: PaaI family thioesterase [Deltaproteobacteria bacterium]|nr:PaaI family thioesterase [Deltaproteobacteria bacterium]